jgi:hypothetical protein
MLGFKILSDRDSCADASRPPGRYRTRREAVAYLRSRGYPLSFSTLAKLCALGKGPTPAGWWGSRPLYMEEGLNSWAEARCRHRPSNQRHTERIPREERR